MKAIVLPLTAAVLLLAQADGDLSVDFPALQTTVPEPRTDGYEQLTFCAVIDNERLCGEELGEHWCRKWDYAGGFVKWTTADEGDISRCPDDDAQCPTVTTITCAGVPINDDVPQ